MIYLLVGWDRICVKNIKLSHITIAFSLQANYLLFLSPSQAFPISYSVMTSTTTNKPNRVHIGVGCTGRRYGVQKPILFYFKF